MELKEPMARMGCLLLPFTDFNVSVDEPIYHSEKGQKFIIVMTGQETDTEITELSDDPLMMAGDKALVFCKNNGDDTYRILDGPQGTDLLMRMENSLLWKYLHLPLLYQMMKNLLIK